MMSLYVKIEYIGNIYDTIR